jgi:hypothetical protein
MKKGIRLGLKACVASAPTLRLRNSPPRSTKPQPKKEQMHHEAPEGHEGFD